MKTRILIVLFAAMLPLMAQPQFGRGGRGAAVGQVGQNNAGNPRGNRLDFLTGYLSLTETQKTAAMFNTLYTVITNIHHGDISPTPRTRAIARS